MDEQKMMEKIAVELRIPVDAIQYIAAYSDGFSIGFVTELEAYKAAYHYRYGNVRVLQTWGEPILWLVRVGG